MSWLWLPVVVAFLTGLVGTAWLRRYALRRALIDVPNDRSSHTTPTPRGGGLSIALVILAAIFALGVSERLSGAVFLALLPAALVVAVIGWLEDHRPMPVILRGMGYLIAAVWFVWFVGGMGEISLGSVKIVSGSEFSISPHSWLEARTGSNLSPQGGKEVNEGEFVNGPHPDPLQGGEGIFVVPWILIAVLLVLGIAWLTNLYNFMDGTDGLAGLQAVLAGGGGGYLLWLQGTESLALLAWMTAAASLGFLIWNWHPARIFMGDVGSCLLGFMFGCLAVLGEEAGAVPALVWVILLGFFFWDATLTLLMRIGRGERWYHAHRSHAYQRLVQLGLSHGQLAWLFLAVNIAGLWPLAWWGYRHPEQLIPAFAISFLLVGLPWAAVQVYYYRHISRS